MKLLQKRIKNKVPDKQTSESFAQKNAVMIDKVIEVNKQVKEFAVFLELHCEIRDAATGDPLKLREQLMMIVDHMDRMTFVFGQLKKTN